MISECGPLTPLSPPRKEGKDEGNQQSEEGEFVIEIDFKKGDGLLPVIIQDATTDEVLMLGYMNQEAWETTLKTKRASFWSRSRQKLWIKGETSGHFQEIKEIYLDCDGDTFY